eukprot:GEZU01021008.1.p1 GENE.GEZU01021008.1~~GEZU01021008.1.p1  ORF type:complete len:359 (+),score=76.23 GEZU01021008.1:267-1343(+)
MNGVRERNNSSKHIIRICADWNLISGSDTMARVSSPSSKDSHPPMSPLMRIYAEVMMFIFGNIVLLGLGPFILLVWLIRSYPNYSVVHYSVLLFLIAYFINFFFFFDKKRDYYNERICHSAPLQRVMDYFPVSIHFQRDKNTIATTTTSTGSDSSNSTSEPFFDPKKTYIIGLHPHGIFGWSSIAFLLGVHRRYREFDGITMRVLSAAALLWIPFVREVLLFIGFIDASKPIAQTFLRQGKSIMIYVGGSLEVIESERNADIVLIMNRRKGFVRLALEEGVDLVPTFTFGQTDLYTQVKSLKQLRQFFVKTLRATITLVYGRFYTLEPVTTADDDDDNNKQTNKKKTRNNSKPHRPLF